MADNKHLSMRLLVDQKAHRVLYAEAGKDVVDFLFGMLGMPIGYVVRLLTTKGMVGCIGNIYQSVSSFDSTYLQPETNKDVLLNPRIQSLSLSKNTLLLEDDASSTTTVKKYYWCGYCSNYGYVTDGHGAPCPSCNREMATEMSYVKPKAGKAATDGGEGDGGYVKGVVTYMVMDDLTVKPMSTISCITLLNSFHVKDVGDLEERLVEFGMEQRLELLKASLESTTTVLTDLFLGKKKVMPGWRTRQASIRPRV